MVMAFGGMLGLLGVQIPGVEIGIGLSALVLGFMVALERRPDLSLAVVLVGFFAVFHGFAHGTELPEGQSGLLYSIGFVASTGTLHASGIGLGLIQRWEWGRSALRFTGAVIALAGAGFTWGALSG
jgi:urease accessory protein